MRPRRDGTRGRQFHNPFRFGRGGVHAPSSVSVGPDRLVPARSSSPLAAVDDVPRRTGLAIPVGPGCTPDPLVFHRDGSRCRRRKHVRGRSGRPCPTGTPQCRQSCRRCSRAKGAFRRGERRCTAATSVFCRCRRGCRRTKCPFAGLERLENALVVALGPRLTGDPYSSFREFQLPLMTRQLTVEQPIPGLEEQSGRIDPRREDPVRSLRAPSQPDR